LSARNSIGGQLPEIGLEPGHWQLPESGSDELGYLVISGMLLRRLILDGGSSVELLGVGDLLLPWREERASFSGSEWQVVDRARLAILDLRACSPLSHSPPAAAAIAARAIDRSRALALQSAIMSIVGIEERLWALLWTLAERWGTVVPGGAEVRVNVPQSVLAEMVGARRPTVSLALGSLSDRGRLVAPEPGRWVLSGEPPTVVAAVPGGTAS
jgi:CRP/FNR family transcriptional regulator, cyclic AMP receptor protein